MANICVLRAKPVIWQRGSTNRHQSTEGESVKTDEFQEVWLARRWKSNASLMLCPCSRGTSIVGRSYIPGRGVSKSEMETGEFWTSFFFIQEKNRKYFDRATSRDIAHPAITREHRTSTLRNRRWARWWPNHGAFLLSVAVLLEPSPTNLSRSVLSRTWTIMYTRFHD